MTPAEEVIERLVAIFGEPKTTNPELFLQEYQNALTGYDARVLHKAVDRVIANATFWPKPAEVLSEARSVASDLYRHVPAEHQKFVPIERTPEQIAAALELVEQFKRTVASKSIEADRHEPDWRRGQRPGSLTKTSRRMSGDDA